MSLKAFHIFFISLSILLSVGLGAWGVNRYTAAGEVGALALGIVFLLTGFALLVYGRGFLRKMREIDA